eukprot:UN28327
MVHVKCKHQTMIVEKLQVDAGITLRYPNINYFGKEKTTKWSSLEALRFLVHTFGYKRKTKDLTHTATKKAFSIIINTVKKEMSDCIRRSNSKEHLDTIITNVLDDVFWKTANKMDYLKDNKDTQIELRNLIGSKLHKFVDFGWDMYADFDSHEKRKPVRTIHLHTDYELWI